MHCWLSYERVNVLQSQQEQKHTEEFVKKKKKKIFARLQYLHIQHIHKNVILDAGCSCCELRLRAVEEDKEEIQEAAASLTAAKGISLIFAVAGWHLQINRTGLWCGASLSEQQRPVPLNPDHLWPRV